MRRSSRDRDDPPCSIHRVQIRIIARRAPYGVPATSGSLVTKPPHRNISFRRFSKKAVRRYAASTAFGIRCASALSAISLGKSVHSAVQSVKVLRSEEHTSELQSLKSNLYAVLCLN